MNQPAERNDVADWWRTSIVYMEPGVLKLRGRPIEELIGNVTFPQMVWLMLRGDLPSEGQAKLFEAALVSAVDHGPQAPSIACARMAVTCGLGLNGAMASAVNFLDDIHGGAGEQAMELFLDIAERRKAGGSLDDAVSDGLEAFRAGGGTFVPGYGHRFHKPVDPRSPRLLALADEAVAQGDISGEIVEIARAIQDALNASKGKPVPMNVDGATAVIYAELGFAPPLARGLFCLSRSVGILAHAWEQMQQGGRNKGPTPPHYRWTYDGPE
jgi:citrate synthase